MTTTDPFTEAANDEAGRLDGQYDLEWESPHQVFARGAEWARTRLAAQEPTDAEVEAAIFAYDDVAVGLGADYAPGAAIRAALSAARAARQDEGTR